MNRFTTKKILITGGSQGIGLAAAARAVDEGATVCIAARTEQKLVEAVAAIATNEARAARIHHVVMDLCDDASVKEGVAAARAKLGGLDIVINNAGYAHPGYVQELPMQVYDEMIQTNYLGIVRVVREALPGMLAARSGHIVNVSSMLGFMGMFGYTAYAGSKFAVAGYTECLRQELLPHGIKVSLCFPPTTDTPGLAKENEVKPPETWAIEGSSRAFSAADVAAALLDGIAREKFEILVGFDSGLIWRLNRAAPWLMRRVLDGILLKHLEKAKRSVVS